MWYMKVVDEIFDFWRPQDFDFFHELAHNRTTTSISRRNGKIFLTRTAHATHTHVSAVVWGVQGYM